MMGTKRVAQAFLITDGAVLSCYGALSLLFLPPPPGEPYLSSGRLLYGVLPIVLGLASFVCALWLSALARNYGDVFGRGSGGGS
jgi:hypothetical protein